MSTSAMPPSLAPQSRTAASQPHRVGPPTSPQEGATRTSPPKNPAKTSPPPPAKRAAPALAQDDELPVLQGDITADDIPLHDTSRGGSNDAMMRTGASFGDMPWAPAYRAVGSSGPAPRPAAAGGRGGSSSGGSGANPSSGSGPANANVSGGFSLTSFAGGSVTQPAGGSWAASAAGGGSTTGLGVAGLGFMMHGQPGPSTGPRGPDGEDDNPSRCFSVMSADPGGSVCDSPATFGGLTHASLRRFSGGQPAGLGTMPASGSGGGGGPAGSENGSGPLGPDSPLAMPAAATPNGLNDPLNRTASPVPYVSKRVMPEWRDEDFQPPAPAPAAAAAAAGDNATPPKLSPRRTTPPKRVGFADA